MKRTITFSIVGVMLFFTCTAIISRRALLYDRYTLSDTFPYRDEQRTLQLDKIDSVIELVMRATAKDEVAAVVDNYKNRNGNAALVTEFTIDRHGAIQDKFGVIRHQAAPLYRTTTDRSPERYARDGSLAIVIDSLPNNFIKAKSVAISGEWYIPKRYLRKLPNRNFKKFIIVDRKFQTITACERSDTGWWLRAANPASTGIESPPYKRTTPLGIFIISDKVEKMMFLHDGSTAVAGFSPYASRFSGGAYIHGIPTNYPARNIIEWSHTLGTTPRSHMCVRCATSFALWVYEWADCDSTVVAVIE